MPKTKIIGKKKIDYRPRKEDWHYCYDCGVELYGKPKKEDMRGITVMMGYCSWCGKKKVTLIPVDDFTGNGD